MIKYLICVSRCLYFTYDENKTPETSENVSEGSKCMILLTKAYIIVVIEGVGRISVASEKI